VIGATPLTATLNDCGPGAAPNVHTALTSPEVFDVRDPVVEPPLPDVNVTGTPPIGAPAESITRITTGEGSGRNAGPV
jgi:hypothetical protein